MLTPELLGQCPTYMYLRDKVEQTPLNIGDVDYMNNRNLHYVPLKVIASVDTTRLSVQGTKELLIALEDGRNVLEYTSWFVDMITDGMPFKSYINTPEFTWEESDDYEYHYDVLAVLNETHSLIVVREDILTKIDTNKEALETTKLLEMELD